MRRGSIPRLPQVLIRRDLEEAAKVLGERIRSGSEDSEVRARQLLGLPTIRGRRSHSSVVLDGQTNHALLSQCVALLQDCFQLGVILLRKKLYTQACKNLEKAKKNWTGDPEELAQVRRFSKPRDFSFNVEELRRGAVVCGGLVRCPAAKHLEWAPQ